MLQQSFTDKNLKKIFLVQNRKGAFLEGSFFPTVKAYSHKLTRIKKKIKKHKSKEPNLSTSLYKSQLNRLYKVKDKLYEERDGAIDVEMKKVSALISHKQFSIQISSGKFVDSKPTYKIPNDAQSYFAEKKLQINIKNECHTSLASRDHIVPSLSNVLSDKFPKIVIRTDIESFYESIDHNILNSKVENSSLSTQSKKLIRKILQEYCNLSNTSKGLPRGIGVSSYLSELYMDEFDDELRKLDGVYFYQRYVDDIIIVISKPKACDVTNILNEVIKSARKIELTTKATKTKTFNTFTVGNYNFEYLGYKFTKQDGHPIKIELSRNKLAKYRSKVDYSINSYSSSNKRDKDKRLLIDRIRFLTGNTKLTNNKGGAFTGIYSSNQWVTDPSQLNGLDQYFNNKLNSITDLTLKRRLSKLKFYDGFKNKSFRSFSASRIGEITKVWKL
ncbi:antiviral reverse transcriptase Drt3a [Vibrio breoganii]